MFGWTKIRSILAWKFHCPSLPICTVSDSQSNRGSWYVSMLVDQLIFLSFRCHRRRRSVPTLSWVFQLPSAWSHHRSLSSCCQQLLNKPPIQQLPKPRVSGPAVTAAGRHRRPCDRPWRGQAQQRSDRARTQSQGNQKQLLQAGRTQFSKFLQRLKNNVQPFGIHCSPHAIHEFSCWVYFLMCCEGLFSFVNLCVIWV